MSSSARFGLRVTSCAAVALTAFGLSANSASADVLPVPDPLIPVVTSVTNSLPSALTVPAAPAAKAPSVSANLVQRRSALLSANSAGISGAAASAAGVTAPAAAVAPGSSLNPSSLGPQLALAIDSFNSSAAGSPLAGLVTSGAGGIIDLRVNAAPLAAACLQALGSGTAVANTTIVFGGTNISAPLVELFPGVLAQCPASATIQPPGTVITLDGTVGGLVGACVRVNRSGLPLNASVLVLDQDLIARLTQAGVPLQQLVVPCPTGPGNGGPSGVGNGGTNASGANNARSRSANSALPAGLNAATASASLPHTGADVLPWVVVAVLLLLGGGALTLAAKRRNVVLPVTKD